MLNGDFTAFASPACNAGRQVTLGGGFVNNQIDPSRLSTVALQLRAATCRRPTADPCGRVQYGIPNNNTEHQSIGKVDYTLSNRQSILARYLYAVYENPATYDGQNVLTLSRTGQKNQAHSIVARPQLPAVGVADQLAARHLQQDDQRSPAARVLHRHRSRQPHRQPAGGLRRCQRHRQRVRGRQRRHQSRLLQLRRLSDRRRRRPGAAATTRSRSAATGSTPRSRRSTTVRPTARSRSTARAPACRSPTSCSAS